MENYIKLFLHDNPPVQTFQNTAFYLAVLMTNPEYYNDFYSDFVNMKWTFDKPNVGLLSIQNHVIIHYNDTFYDKATTKLEGWEEYGQAFHKQQIIHTIKQLLSDGYYIAGEYDEYYIKVKSAFKSFHFIHDFYLYGYDDSEECFFSAGVNKHGQYCWFSILYDEIYDALSGYGNAETFERVQKWGVRIYSFKIKDNVKFQFNKQNLISELHEYLKENSDNPEKEDVFGISTYDIIHNSTAPDLFDPRNYRIIYEHKNIMYNRIRYLEANGYVKPNEYSQKYHEISQLGSNAFCLAVKYVITKNDSLLDRIKLILLNLKSEEEKVLPYLTDELDKFIC